MANDAEKAFHNGGSSGEGARIVLCTRAASLEKVSRFLARCSENMHIPFGSLHGGHALDLARGGVIRKSVVIVMLGHEAEIPQSLNLAPYDMRCDGVFQ